MTNIQNTMNAGSEQVTGLESLKQDTLAVAVKSAMQNMSETTDLILNMTLEQQESVVINNAMQAVERLDKTKTILNKYAIEALAAALSDSSDGDEVTMDTDFEQGVVANTDLQAANDDYNYEGKEIDYQEAA